MSVLRPPRRQFLLSTVHTTKFAREEQVVEAIRMLYGARPARVARLKRQRSKKP